ncbi:MAG TPA: dienelactone hydrolase family protein [Phycisphaerae bacterium]|jgi:carboxymethylenebutenolidase
MLMRMLSVVAFTTSIGLAQEPAKPKGGEPPGEPKARQDSRAPLGEMRKIEVRGNTYDWYVAEGRGDAKQKPGLIVIQEWWGLNDWIKGNADHFAKLGYTAVAVDLYHGKVASDPDLAHELMRGLPEDQALTDLRAAVTSLWENPNIDRVRIGCIGWCMGGGYALKIAVADPRVTACVMCYGAPITDAEQLKSLNASLLGIFGQEDRGISVESVEKFKAALKKAGIKHSIHVFPEVGHAFMNPNNVKGYNANWAKEAWKHIDEFLDAALRPSP